VHPTLYGPVVDLEDAEPNELLGVNALVYGHQYLVISTATCAIAADLGDLKTAAEDRFKSVADLQQREIRRLTGT
jgi:hypothetical protein